MVVEDGLTARVFPVPTRVPPHDPVYHLILSFAPPPPPFKVRVELPPLQIAVGEAVAEVGLEDF
jgi:hypothetical protein